MSIELDLLRIINQSYIPNEEGFSISSFEPKGIDREDFVSIHVSTLQDILLQAYLAGAENLAKEINLS